MLSRLAWRKVESGYHFVIRCFQLLEDKRGYKGTTYPTCATVKAILWAEKKGVGGLSND
jgi:hypothetical protein